MSKLLIEKFGRFNISQNLRLSFTFNLGIRHCSSSTSSGQGKGDTPVEIDIKKSSKKHIGAVRYLPNKINVPGKDDSEAFHKPQPSIEQYENYLRLIRAESRFPLERLKDSDASRRYRFAKTFLEKIDKNPEIQDYLFFSDEGNFWPFLPATAIVPVSGNRGTVEEVSKRRYSKKKLYAESEKLPTIVWCAMNGKDIIGPYFFNSYVTDRSYYKMLKTYLVKELQEKKYDVSKVWFQQDGAPPHRSQKVLEFLNKTFGKKLIGMNGNSIEWPPRSQDLSPMDYFLWDYLKIRLVNYNPTTEANLRLCLQFEMETMDPELLEYFTVTDFRKRLIKCINANGHRFE